MSSANRPTRRRTLVLAGAAALLAVSAAAALMLTGASGGADEFGAPDASELPREQPADQTNAAASVIARGLDQPVWVGPAPGDDPQALWIAERSGRLVRRSGPGLRSEQIWADVSDRISTGAEQGLLSVAFTPDFDASREVVLSLTETDGSSRVELWRLGDRPGEGRALRVLISIQQPFPNHNGGHVAFGAHRTLYAGFGDGGGAGDPNDMAQEPGSNYGKIFAGELTQAGRLEDWRPVVTGARNPWRFWIDPALGDMWIGDVGQDRAEEINRVRLDTSVEPANTGWSLFEGVERIDGGEREVRGTQTLTWPVATYGHEHGRCSVTGGMVYRGGGLPQLRGRYLFTDFCTGELWSLLPGAGITASDLRLEQLTLVQPAHLGLDAAGEPLIASLDGTVSRLIAPR